MSGQNASYFQTRPGAPAPLSVIVQKHVRCEEVDPLGVVWHGGQLYTNEKFEVQLIRPKFIEKFCDQWKRKLFG